MIDLKHKEIGVKYFLLKMWKKVTLIHVIFKLSTHWNDFIKDLTSLSEELPHAEHH